MPTIMTECPRQLTAQQSANANANGAKAAWLNIYGPGYYQQISMPYAKAKAMADAFSGVSASEEQVSK